jgi:Ricin-type beta-trefoil lectin domain
VGRVQRMGAGVLCLVALFVAATLEISAAHAATKGGDAAPAAMQRVSVDSADYFVGTGLAFIKNVNSGKCMGVAGGSQNNGTFVVQWTCHQIIGSDQDMLIRQVDGIWHRIEPQHATNKCLGVSAASMVRGTSLIQWTCSGGWEQQYAFRITSSGFEVIVRHSKQCVAVSGGHMGDGGRVIQWTCLGYADQRWRFV